MKYLRTVLEHRKTACFSTEIGQAMTEIIMCLSCVYLFRRTFYVCVCVCVLVGWTLNVSVSGVTRVMNLFAKWSERAPRCAARGGCGPGGRAPSSRRRCLYSFINRENYISRITGIVPLPALYQIARANLLCNDTINVLLIWKSRLSVLYYNVMEPAHRDVDVRTKQNECLSTM